MKVTAAKGSKCPKEGNPREYITDDNAVDVPDTAYYKRLIADGSLIAEGTVPDLRTEQGGVVESGLSPKSKRGGKE
jgi:hypothetical protein